MKSYTNHSWWGWIKTNIFRVTPYDCNMQAIIDYLASHDREDAARDLEALRDQYKALQRG